MHRFAIVVLSSLLVITACAGEEERPVQKPSNVAQQQKAPAPVTSTTAKPLVDVLAGMLPVTNKNNIYANAGAGMLSDAVKNDRQLVYVPHTKSGLVWVINPETYEVINKYDAGIEVQHVVPSYDMRTLYATDDIGNQVLPIDPATGKAGEPFPVIDPYNMYFTPDGKSAISVAEKYSKLVWYDAKTWEIQKQTPVDCAGIDHAAFSMDGKTVVFTCEWSGRLSVFDVANKELVRYVNMPERNTHMGPQDITLAPDGSHYYIADCDADSVWVLNSEATKVTGRINTGNCPHGLYYSRDAKRLFVTNRLEGSISVLDAYTGDIKDKWQIPGGGSPDMGNLTADGKQLWISGRYHNEVYVISTADGSLIKKISVGPGPHGLTVWPQPGRYSVGHTGITR